MNPLVFIIVMLVSMISFLMIPERKRPALSMRSVVSLSAVLGLVLSVVFNLVFG